MPPGRGTFGFWKAHLKGAWLKPALPFCLCRRPFTCAPPGRGTSWFQIYSFHDVAPTPLRGLIFRHRNNGAGERTVGLSQLIQNREVIGVGDRYQVAWDMPLRPVGMVIAAARYHGRQLAGAVGDTQRLVDDRPPNRRELLDFLLAQPHLVVDMRGVAQRTEIEHARDCQPRRYLGMIKNE